MSWADWKVTVIPLNHLAFSNQPSQVVISGTIEHVVYLPDFDRDLHVCLKYFLHFLVNTSTPTRDNVLCKYSISIKTICLSWKFLTSKNSNAAVVRPLTHGYRQQQVGVI